MIVERFLQWVQTAPAARRAEAAHALARAYLYSPLSAAERDAVDAAMTMLLDDPAPEVRLAIADALAASADAPHHIILSLAFDRTQAASLVAERSPLLLDSELVEIVASQVEALQIAVARRPLVSRAVAAALAEVGSAEACVALLSNGGARVARFSLDRIVERHGDDPGLRETLLDRSDLPAEVRHALVSRLAQALGALALARNWLSPERTEALTRDCRDRATLAIAGAANGDLAGLVRRLIATGQLTPALLMRAAASGQARFFEAALAALSGVPPPRVAALLASGRAAALQALLRRAGLPERTFAAFAAAAEVIRRSGEEAGAESNYRRASQLIEAVVDSYRRRPDRDLDQILALLRRFSAEARRDAARGYAAEVLHAA